MVQFGEVKIHGSCRVSDFERQQRRWHIFCILCTVYHCCHIALMPSLQANSLEGISVIDLLPSAVVLMLSSELR